MIYKSPTAEQRFVLDHVAGVADFAVTERFAYVDSDTVDAVLEGIAQFAVREYSPTNRKGDTIMPRWDDGAVTMPPGFRDAYRSCVKGGWNGVDSSIEYGGMGLPYALASAVLETLGTANMGLTLVHLLTAGAVHALEAYGTEAQKVTWLPRLVSGEWSGTMNLTEPSAGSDVGALRTIAEPISAGEHAGLWKLSGQKIFISFGEHDLTENIVHLVLARTPGAPAGTKGLSLFLVPKFRLNSEGQPAIPNGVRCLSIEHKLGIHSSPTCVMAYSEDGDSLGELIGEVGGGMPAMFVMMNSARLNVGNQGVQIAERATQHALAYARDRVQSARASVPGGGAVAIIEHPDVRRMALRMKALTEGARALVYYAASQIDRSKLGDLNAGARADILIPLAKAWASDVGCEVASLGVQVHGGMGFIEETGAAQHFRDARIAPIYEGTNGIQAADLVSRKLFLRNGAPLDQLIAEIIAETKDEPELANLAQTCAEVTDWMRVATIDDRLSGSVDYLAMLATTVAGWLMALQFKTATGNAAKGIGDSAFLRSKMASCRFFIDRIVPEASGRKSGALAGSVELYRVKAQDL